MPSIGHTLMQKPGKDKEGALNFTLPKSERLCGTKAVEELFSTGQSYFSYPFKIIFTKSDQSIPFPKILISIPKRVIKKAVQRNKLKRQLKEIYRLNKNDFWPPHSNNYIHTVGIIFAGKEPADFEFLKKKLILALQRLKSEVN
jgi:ribonuclease P protein component